MSDSSGSWADPPTPTLTTPGQLITPAFRVSTSSKHPFAMRSPSLLPFAALVVLLSLSTCARFASAVSSIPRDEAHLIRSIRSGKDKCGKIVDADDCDDEDE